MSADSVAINSLNSVEVAEVLAQWFMNWVILCVSVMNNLEKTETIT